MKAQRNPGPCEQLGPPIPNTPERYYTITKAGGGAADDATCDTREEFIEQVMKITSARAENIEAVEKLVTMMEREMPRVFVLHPSGHSMFCFPSNSITGFVRAVAQNAARSAERGKKK